MNEEFIQLIVSQFVRFTEIGAAAVIFTGALIGFYNYVSLCLIKKVPKAFTHVRIGLGRYLTLGLEFQLASDLLRSAVAPSFEEIGKLAAVAAIRTALNYFLSREIEAAKKDTEVETAQS